MAQFVKVGSRTEFEDLERGRLVEAGGHRIAVFNVGGHYYTMRSRIVPSSGATWIVGGSH